MIFKPIISRKLFLNFILYVSMLEASESQLKYHKNKSLFLGKTYFRELVFSRNFFFSKFISIINFKPVLSVKNFISMGGGKNYSISLNRYCSLKEKFFSFFHGLINDKDVDILKKRRVSNIENFFCLNHNFSDLSKIYIADINYRLNLNPDLIQAAFLFYRKKNIEVRSMRFFSFWLNNWIAKKFYASEKIFLPNIKDKNSSFFISGKIKILCHFTYIRLNLFIKLFCKIAFDSVQENIRKKIFACDFMVLKNKFSFLSKYLIYFVYKKIFRFSYVHSQDKSHEKILPNYKFVLFFGFLPAFFNETPFLEKTQNLKENKKLFDIIGTKTTKTKKILFNSILLRSNITFIFSYIDVRSFYRFYRHQFIEAIHTGKKKDFYSLFYLFKILFLNQDSLIIYQNAIIIVTKIINKNLKSIKIDKFFLFLNLFMMYARQTVNFSFSSIISIIFNRLYILQSFDFKKSQPIFLLKKIFLDFAFSLIRKSSSNFKISGTNKIYSIDNQFTKKTDGLICFYEKTWNCLFTIMFKKDSRSFDKKNSIIDKLCSCLEKSYVKKNFYSLIKKKITLRQYRQFEFFLFLETNKINHCKKNIDASAQIYSIYSDIDKQTNYFFKLPCFGFLFPDITRGLNAEFKKFLLINLIDRFFSFDKIVTIPWIIENKLIKNLKFKLRNHDSFSSSKHCLKNHSMLNKFLIYGTNR